MQSLDYSQVPHSKLTNQEGINRFGRRVEHIFARNVSRLKGKKVLDLACNTGRLAYPLLMLGAQSVTGVEARAELIETGREIFKNSPYHDKMTFVQSDLFDYLENCQPHTFDVIVCAGFLYHTVRQVDFFREMKRLQPETFIVDTNVAKNYFWFGPKTFGKPPALFVAIDDPDKTSDTTDNDGVVFWPSTSFLEEMIEVSGYNWKRINFKENSNGNWSAMDDYRKGTRASYLATRK